MRWAAALGLLLAGSSARAERPAPGQGYEADVTLQSHPSPGGGSRVWFVTTSDDAVDITDTDNDGVPDHVADVALVADQSLAAYAEAGFEPPIEDVSLLDPADVGGDGRFDIYLADFANADGSFRIDLCVDEPDRCAGHAVVDNDFAEFDYPTPALGVRTVVSHELFHAVQAAYDPNQDVKWSEGSAVWAQEQVFPEQSDFENKLAAFLARPERPFDRRSGSAFGDLYPYGAALWPTFLTERYGANTVRDVWRECVDDGGDPDFLDAADVVLERDHGETVEDAWAEFAAWNLYTGDRSDPGRAYSAAESWPLVALQPMAEGPAIDITLPMEGLSARYLPVSLPDAGSGRLTVATATGEPCSGELVVDGARTPLEPGDDPARISTDIDWAGDTIAHLVLISRTRGAAVRDVRITMSAGSGGCSVGGVASAGWWLTALALAAAARRSRRRQAGQ